MLKFLSKLFCFHDWKLVASNHSCYILIRNPSTGVDNNKIIVVDFNICKKCGKRKAYINPSISHDLAGIYKRRWEKSSFIPHYSDETMFTNDSDEKKYKEYTNG